MKLHTFRLKPEQDLRKEIQQYADVHHIQAGFIVTCVAGLDKAVLRMAGAAPDNQIVNTYNEKLEVVSMVGTVSTNGSHLHISLSKRDGQVIGGHLKDGSLVAYTAEVVIGEDETKVYTREADENTGFDELVVKGR